MNCILGRMFSRRREGLRVCAAALLPDHAGFAQTYPHPTSVPHDIGKYELPGKAGLETGTIAVFALIE